MIVIPVAGGPERELWDTLIDLAEREPTGWTLVGGLMVYLCALEVGQIPPRVTRDLDVLADLRARPAVLPRIVDSLGVLGFEVELSSSDTSGHRFLRGDVTIDLLAPDNVGRRADMRTVDALTTVSIPGGSYALDRSRVIDIHLDIREGTIPCPDLAGALIVKAEAARSDRMLGPDRHLSDLAVLFSLVPDPFLLRDALGRRNVQRLAAVSALGDDGHEAWRALPDARRRAGVAARSVVIASA